MNYRFGKHPPKVDYRTYHFPNALTASQLTPPPPSYDASDRVLASLHGQTFSKLFPMDGNDTLGDCTIAAKAHALTLYRGLTSKVAVPSAASVKKNYLHLSGGIDSGLNVLDVLNDWRKNSFDRDKLAAFASVGIKNIDHVKQAIHMFGGVYLGFQVPANCMKQFEAGEPWTPGRLTQDGHCVFAVGYTPTTVKVITWGAAQMATWAWWTACVDEAYVLLPPEAKVAGFAPGFSYEQLTADIVEVA